MTDSIVRFLADASYNNGDGTAQDGSYAEEEEHFGVHITYSDLYSAILFLAAIYAAGVFASSFLRMPSLVGEIIAGILLGPNFASLVPIPEAFVLLGEIGLILLVLEAGVDIDLTTLRLIGSRGVMIAIVGTLIPVALAYLIARLLGLTGVAAVAAGCTFAPTSLGIAMNILRRAGIVNTPVGQLIVAAAIIDDMIALVILSQLQAFAGDGDLSIVEMMIPVISALGFLIVGGYLAIFVLPKVLDKAILNHVDKHNREWTAMAIMFVLLLALIPATKAAKASPLMGAFLAGLVFCSSNEVHHMFVSQFKRVMQWLLRIFFAASIGFQVPIQQFGNVTVLLQGLVFTLALLGKVGVGFLVPNFSFTQRFTGLHLRDCLVVGFSMAAEGEFAFIIAGFAASHEMITKDLYASVVLAVLVSTIVPPFLLRSTISYYTKKLENVVYGDKSGGKPSLEQGIRDKKVVFWCIQTKSAPSWGLHTNFMQTLNSLDLEVIDHRSWHPRQSQDTLVNEVFVRDIGITTTGDDMEGEKQEAERKNEIISVITSAFHQPDALVRARRWIPDVPEDDDSSVQDWILRSTGSQLENSMKGVRRFSVAYEESDEEEEEDKAYTRMEDPIKPEATASSRPAGRRMSRSISLLEPQSKFRLDGLFRRDRRDARLMNMPTAIEAVESSDGIELLDVHGIPTGRREVPEKYDYHGASLS
jgi:Kef-type K+ transport system membrane component KefB